MKVIELRLLEYSVDTEPDCKAIGKLIDEQIKRHFMGRKILLRGIGSQEHSGKSVDELVTIIQQAGTDRYDPRRTGDRYENIESKHIDLFAFPATVSSDMDLAWQVIYGFYHNAIGVHGYPIRIDVLTIYDAGKFEEVAHQYAGRDDIKRDGFIFIDQNHKQGTVLGIIKLL